MSSFLHFLHCFCELQQNLHVRDWNSKIFDFQPALVTILCGPKNINLEIYVLSCFWFKKSIIHFNSVSLWSRFPRVKVTMHFLGFWNIETPTQSLKSLRGKGFQWVNFNFSSFLPPHHHQSDPPLLLSPLLLFSFHLLLSLIHSLLFPLPPPPPPPTSPKGST